MKSQSGLLKILYTKIRMCPVCDAPFTGLETLCSYCVRLVCAEVQRSPAVCHTQDGVKIFSLFIWDEDSRGIVKHLIYKLKGGGFPGVQLWLAELFYFKFSGENRSLPRIFIPAASLSKSKRKDHAETWAQALSKTYGKGCWYNPLLRKKGRQKYKSIDERRNTKFSFSKQRVSRFYAARKLRPVVFCDDVVTSGSTAKAAFKALGEPENFEVWALAYRSKIEAEYVSASAKN